MTGVQRRDLPHFFFGEDEIEDIEVFFHPLWVGRLDQRNDPTLGQPTKDDLRRRSPMSRADTA